MGNEGDRDRLTGAGNTGTVTKLPAVDTVAGTGDSVDGRNAQGQPQWEDQGESWAPIARRQNPSLAQSALSVKGAKNVPGQSPESNDFSTILQQSSDYLKTHPASVPLSQTRRIESNDLKKPGIVAIGKGHQYTGAAAQTRGPISMPLTNGRSSRRVSFKEPADIARGMVSYHKDTILPMTKPAAGMHQDAAVDSNNFHTSAKQGRVKRSY